MGDDVCFPAVSTGDLYIACLTAFRFGHRAVVPGRYVLVGDAQGLFVHRGLRLGSDPGAARFTRVGVVGGPGAGLPAPITIGQAARS